MADQLARKYKGFPGGVYLFDDPDADQAYNIQNMILDLDGHPYKRQGFKLQSQLPVGVSFLSLYRWDRPANPPQLLAQGSDGKLYYSTDLVNWTDSGGGVILSTTVPASFEAFLGAGVPYVYIADGTNPVRRWSGSAVTNAPGQPATAVRYLRVWKDTLFGLTVGDRMYSSAAADGDVWPALNWVDIGKADGDVGTALFTASQELIVSKQKRTWVIVSPTTYENRVVDYEKGVESHFSVVKFDAEIFYITRLGVARFVSGAPAELMSKNIQPVFTPLFTDLSKLNRVWGYRIHHRVGWCLTRVNHANPDFVIEFYPHLQRLPWTFHNMPMKAAVTWRDANERLFFSDGSRALLQAYAANQFTDEGVTGWDPYFRGTIQLIWDDFGDSINRKYLRAIRMFGEGNVYLQVLRDRMLPGGQLMNADLSIPNDPIWNEPGDLWNPQEQWGLLGSFGTDIVYPDQYGRQFSVVMFDVPGPDVPAVPAQRRWIADNLILYAHGWSLLELTLEAVRMGELG